MKHIKEFIYFINESNNRITILLDLDETLIHQENNEEMKYNSKIDPFFPDDPVIDYSKFDSFISKNGENTCLIRPHLKEFLDFLFKNFNVGVFTAQGKEYAIYNSKEIFKDYYNDLIAIYSNEDMTYSGYKDLTKLNGIDINNTYLIDDNLGDRIKPKLNAIQIKAFWNNINDTYLLDMIKYLKTRFL